MKIIYSSSEILEAVEIILKHEKKKKKRRKENNKFTKRYRKYNFTSRKPFKKIIIFLNL